MKTKLLLAFIALCTLANAQTNYALDFNGTTDFVDLGSGAANNLRSIELWFKPTANITSSMPSQSYSIVGRDDGSQLNEYGLLIRGSEYPTSRGCLQFYISENSTYYYAISNNSSWSAGTWYHVAATIDAVTGMKLYINGVLQTITDTYSNPIPGASDISTLGRWGGLNMRYFPGRIDEVRFWNRTLTPAEILQKMCYWIVPANETGLVGYWKLDEGSGTTINDATTNGNNGVIMGASFVQDDNCFIGTIGINETAAPHNVSVSPNPFSSVTILKSSEKLTNANLIIYNSIGQEVRQVKNISGETVSLNRDGLPAGLYFIQLSQEGKAIITEKIVITD